MKEIPDTATVYLPLFDALLRYADDVEKRHLEAIAQDKPKREDMRRHRSPSTADQWLEVLESIAELDAEEEARARFRIKAAEFRSKLEARREVAEDNADPHVQYERAIVTIHEILTRMLKANVTFSGFLFGDTLPERKRIVAELVQTATVYWSGSANACMISDHGDYIYRFEYVAVDVPAYVVQTARSKSGSRGMPLDVLNRRMDKMKELVSQGMKRQPAARMAIHAVPHRDQSEPAAVKSLMREWDTRRLGPFGPTTQTGHRQA